MFDNVFEAEETFEMTARREAYEEVGVSLGNLREFGYFQLIDQEKLTEEIIPTFIANALTFEPIPEGSESLCMRLMTLEELEDSYFVWDDLMAAVFSHAWKNDPNK